MNKTYIHNYVTVKSNIINYNGENIFSSDCSDDVGSFLKKVYREFGIKYPKYFKMDRLSKLGFIASEILFKEENLENHNPSDYGLIFANSSSSLDTDYKFQESLSSIASPSVFVYTLANIVTGEIAIRRDFKGEICFFIQEKPDFNFLSNYCKQVLLTTKTKNIVLAWVELDPNGKYCAYMADVSNSQSELELSEKELQRIFKV